MKLKRMVSVMAALTVSATMFASMAITANAISNPSDTLQIMDYSFEEFVEGAISVDTPSNGAGTQAFKDANGTLIPRLYAYYGASPRMLFENFNIVSENGNKYITGKITPNNSNRVDFYNTGILKFGDRDGTRYDRRSGTYIAELKIRPYESLTIMLNDQTNSDTRSGFLDYLGLSIDADTQTATWVGSRESGSFEMSIAEWHSIVVIDTLGSLKYDGDTYLGLDHNVTLYVDGIKIGTTVVTQTSTANGANSLAYIGFIANKVQATTVEVDDVSLYRVNTTDEAIIANIESSEKEITIEDSPVNVDFTVEAIWHNNTDKINIESLFDIGTWKIEGSPEGVSINNEGVLTVDPTYEGSTVTVNYVVDDSRVLGSKSILVKKNVIPSAVSATHEKDYTDEEATDADTGASLWKAMIKGTGTAYNAFDITGTIKNADVTVKSNNKEYDMGTTISTGDVYIYIAVNQAVSKLESGQTMELTVTPLSK